jgi:hypothetical protein
MQKSVPGGAAGDKRRGTVGARGRRVVQHRDHGPRGDSAAPPGAQPAGRPMSARRLSAAGLAALKRAVNDSATVERFRSKAVQVPGSQCLWWTGAVSGRGQWARAWPVLCRLVHRVWTRPPSIEKSVPVTLPALSLASSSARSATSSGRVKRPVTASAAAFAATSPGLTPAAWATV